MILSIRHIEAPSKQHPCKFCELPVAEKAIRESSLEHGKTRMKYYHALCYKLHRQGHIDESTPL